MGKFAIGFEHFLIAENQFGTEALLKIRNIVSTLFLAESNYDSETLRGRIAQSVQVRGGPDKR